MSKGHSKDMCFRFNKKFITSQDYNQGDISVQYIETVGRGKKTGGFTDDHRSVGGGNTGDQEVTVKYEETPDKLNIVITGAKSGSPVTGDSPVSDLDVAGGTGHTDDDV